MCDDLVDQKPPHSGGFEAMKRDALALRQHMPFYLCETLQTRTKQLETVNYFLLDAMNAIAEIELDLLFIPVEVDMEF
jgi:hypothetical protein